MMIHIFLYDYIIYFKVLLFFFNNCYKLYVKISITSNTIRLIEVFYNNSEKVNY